MTLIEKMEAAARRAVPYEGLTHNKEASHTDRVCAEEYCEHVSRVDAWLAQTPKSVTAPTFDL